jgi:uncharacterized protein YndB with AHSA1/START domain
VNATYETIDGRPALRFERTLGHPVEMVWRAVTEPGELAHWFPSEVEADLRPGGAMTFTFREHELPPMSGEVVALEPPRLFAFTWGGSELRFELEPDADGCRLVFTHFLEDREAAARDAAGWEVCLARLEQHLAGDDAAGPDTGVTPEWSAFYEKYVQSGMPSGAPIPGSP